MIEVASVASVHFLTVSFLDKPFFRSKKVNCVSAEGSRESHCDVSHAVVV